jgi:transposase
MAAALTSRSVPVAVVNPRQVRNFARTFGELAKTDTIDASAFHVRAHDSAIRPAARTPKDAYTRELADGLSRRGNPWDMRVR